MVKDINGRYLIIQGLMGTEDYTLVNIYAPNVKQRDFYELVFKEMEKVKKGYVIMAGDFNMVLDKVKDKSVCKKDDISNRNTVLSKMMEMAGMKDIWR